MSKFSFLVSFRKPAPALLPEALFKTISTLGQIRFLTHDHSICITRTLLGSSLNLQDRNHGKFPTGLVVRNSVDPRLLVIG